MSTYLTQSPKETLALAKKLAPHLKRGALICLFGELGVGKTVFTQGLALGLGLKEKIKSPTFTLMQVYKKNQKLKIKNQKLTWRYFVHLDAFRIKEPKEILEIGAVEWWQRKDTITVIEWADKVRRILPSKRVEIRFRLGKNEKRRITICSNF